VLLLHHQPSRDVGTVAGILKPSAGKQDVSALATSSGPDVPITIVWLDMSKGCSCAAAVDWESISQGTTAMRAFRNIIGAQRWGDVVSCPGGRLE